jgi:hypothetical protein
MSCITIAHSVRRILWVSCPARVSAEIDNQNWRGLGRLALAVTLPCPSGQRELEIRGLQTLPLTTQDCDNGLSGRFM